MLVLSRKPEQRIQIGDNITITVLRLRGGTVQIGIEAPRSTPVVRGELQPLPQSALEQNPEAEAADQADSDAATSRASRSLTARSGAAVEPFRASGR